MAPCHCSMSRDARGGQLSSEVLPLYCLMALVRPFDCRTRCTAACLGFGSGVGSGTSINARTAVLGGDADSCCMSSALEACSISSSALSPFVLVMLVMPLAFRRRSAASMACRSFLVAGESTPNRAVFVFAGSRFLLNVGISLTFFKCFLPTA